MKQKPNMYFQWGVTAFLVILASIVSYVVLNNLPGFFAVISEIFRIFAPILVGVLFAYLLNPLVRMFEQVVMAPRIEKSKKPERTKKVGRALAIIFALLITGVILYGLFYLVLPQLYDTVLTIANNLPAYFDKARSWVLHLLKGNETLRDSADRLMENAFTNVQKLLGDDLINTLQTVMVGMTNFGVAVVRTVLNIILGLVASLYMLWSKETFQARGKRLVVAVFRPRTADYLLRVGRESHRIFSGFLVGKIMDSIIIGILCYIGMLILRLPFPVLISAVVGTTNLIPMFGPIIGAVPCALLILVVNPLQALYFVVLDIVLQQLDGNVIGPKILGDSIGLSGFWVLFSITIFGNLFGVIGMILGIPFFALIYIFAQDLVNRALIKKEKPLEADAYYSLSSVSDLPAVTAHDEVPSGDEDASRTEQTQEQEDTQK